MFFSNSPYSSPTSSLSSIYSYSTYTPTQGSSERPHSPSSTCAYPSWPRRSSLHDSESAPSEHVHEATSFVSDDDLFPSVFDDAESDCSPIASPRMNATVHALADIVSHASVRDLMALGGGEKKKLVGAGMGSSTHVVGSHAKRRRSSRKSRTSSAGTAKELSPIAEGGE